MVIENPQTTKTLAVIPARYASTRFPGKPLALIHDKPMIQHAFENVAKATLIDRVIVATDDQRILAAVEQAGGEARMTDGGHASGTDRIWEVARELPEYDLVLNVQGDEPFIDPTALDRMIAAMRETPAADIYTMVTPLLNEQEWRDPNVVKALLSRHGQALYFSRAAIPHPRDGGEGHRLAFRHLGLYLYRRSALKRFTALPASPLEELEKLEQLRALEDGMTFFALEEVKAPMGIDTPADLETLLKSVVPT